jgi:hypothetical protein
MRKRVLGNRFPQKLPTDSLTVAASNGYSDCYGAATVRERFPRTLKLCITFVLSCIYLDVKIIGMADEEAYENRL